MSAQAGGVLELQVYGGADASFEMVEDDGTTYAYQRSARAGTRTTTWTWTDATKTLRWAAEGAAKPLYTHVAPVLFEAAAKKAQRAALQALSASGKVTFA